MFKQYMCLEFKKSDSLLIATMKHPDRISVYADMCNRASYSILFYPITLEGRRGTTDEFATIPFHLDLFSAALVELAKSTL